MREMKRTFFIFEDLSGILMTGYRIAAFSSVAELVKSFDSPRLSKVLTTSATLEVNCRSLYFFKTRLVGFILAGGLRP